MSDNITSPVPAGTVIATDDIAGVQYPRTKVAFGTDGTATDVSVGAPLPVTVVGQASCTSTRTIVSANQSTVIDVARTTRAGLQFTLETAPSADVFINFSSAASATSYDLLIPSGTLKGDVSFAMFPPRTQISAFSTAAVTINTGSWIAV